MSTMTTNRNMDITAFIASKRETLLIADHATYRAQLSRQILATRKRLGRTTPKREKFTRKPLTAADVKGNVAFVHLQILIAERAWAHALHIKNSHAEDEKGITGSARAQICSKLWKAAKTAAELVDVLREAGSERDLLEARTYTAMLAGAEEFEKQAEGVQKEGGDERWNRCLKRWSEARVGYAALWEKERAEVFREMLANTVDPTIRYAAYQARLSRTIAIDVVARRYFPKEDAEAVRLVEAVDSFALKEKPKAESGEEKKTDVLEVPDFVTWRGRRANIVDASIGQALASVTAAEAKLKAYLAEHPSASASQKAAAYDDILIASQDAADASKRATDELEKERVDEGDARMQDLRVTSLAVNYDLVSWRVGRNRILIGDSDGLTFEAQKLKKSQRARKDGTELPEKDEGRGRKLARLRERVVLYDATIQSVESIKDLRGAMRDETFVRELDGKSAYFRALKCVNISYSHALLDNHLNALALLKRAQDFITAHPPPESTASTSTPPTLDIPSSESSNLKTHINNLLARTHALVEMHKLSSNSAIAAQKNMTSAAPTVQNLHAYPTPGLQVDLTNLVSYPPKIQPVPVKPLFLDVAWNYIDYPGRASAPAVSAPASAPEVNGGDMDVDEPAPAQEKKKGWFGFGR
jgi:signal recognition particle subunit SRP68